MWWAQTIKPNTPIDHIAKIMPKWPNAAIFPVFKMIIWEIKPKPGKIRIYTSGWPKNQKRCWNNTGSPPPAGSKNLVLKFRSRRSIVIAPARTGRARINKTTVTLTDQLNNETWCIINKWHRILKIVLKKLIEPIIDEAPAKCREKNSKINT